MWNVLPVTADTIQSDVWNILPAATVAVHVRCLLQSVPTPLFRPLSVVVMLTRA